MTRGPSQRRSVPATRGPSQVPARLAVRQRLAVRPRSQPDSRSVEAANDSRSVPAVNDSRSVPACPSQRPSQRNDSRSVPALPDDPDDSRSDPDLAGRPRRSDPDDPDDPDPRSLATANVAVYFPKAGNSAKDPALETGFSLRSDGVILAQALDTRSHFSTEIIWGPTNPLDVPIGLTPTKPWRS